MPNNGSLDSIVLEISGTSEKANESINKITGSLRSFARAVGTVVPALRSLNSELSKLARYGNIKLPNVSLGTGGKAAANSAKKMTEEQIKAWQAAAAAARTYSNTAGANNMIPEDQMRKLHPEWYTTEQERAAKAFQNASNGGQASWAKENEQAAQSIEKVSQKMQELQPVAKGATSSLRSLDNELKQKKGDGKSAEEGLNGAARGANAVGQAAQKNASHLSKFGQTIKRIATTMLIRTALRSMMKAFSESWQAAYEFSNSMGGSFAKSVDAAKTMLADTATTVIQTIAPVFEALVPVLYVITNAFQYLCTALQSLLNLLGLTSDLFGKSASDINKYSNSSNKATKANKNMLASWDKLNVIQSKGGSGGSGSGSSYKPGAISKVVSQELGAIMSVVMGEGMFAVGLILATTGHLGAGIPLMLLGAAAIASPTTEHWGELAEKIKGEIASIMALIGGAMLCIGSILVFSGANLPLGIGLMIAGVANMVTAVALSWDLSDTIKLQVGKINAIIGAGLLTIGAILALSGANVPLGIGMMIAGGISLASAVALNWDSIVTTVKNVMTEIADWFTARWDEISSAVGVAWDAVSKWWGENVSPEIEKVWNGVLDFFDQLFGDPTREGSIAMFAKDAWNIVSDWWTTNVTANVEKQGAWGGIKGFFKGIFVGADGNGGICGFMNNAFAAAKQWWTENVSGEISAAWDSVSGYFSSLLGDSETGIIGSFNMLWAEISQLWGDITGYVTEAWGSVSKWFNNNVTVPVGNFFIDCINGIIDGINWLIGVLNSIHITIPAVELPLVGQLWGETKIGISGIALLNKMEKLIPQEADGAYGIPRGDLFIANEAGAELVGNLNGRTTVANQDQIIEGIRKGVRDANADQNELLRRQNELLLGIFEKTGVFTFEPSAAWGKANERSAELWAMQTGR